MNTHIGLFAENPEALVRFYVEKLDFQEAGTRLIPKSLMILLFGLDADCEMIKLRRGDIILEIFAPEGMELRRKTDDMSGYNHWGITVKNKGDYCHRLEQKGVTVIKAEKGGRFIYFIKDPEGNRIEVFDV